MGQRKGYKHSEETKKRISKALKGKPSPFKGRKWGPYPKERIEKVRRALIGGTQSIESNKKRSMAETGEKNHFYGKTHSKSSKEKMREFSRFHEEVLNNNSIFCEYGCGLLARYITGKNRKYCCSDHRSKCLKMKEKNAKGNEGRELPRGKDSKLFGRKRPGHSTLMKEKNPMFNSVVKNIFLKKVKSAGYRSNMSKIVTLRWEDESYREKILQIYLDKGIKRTDEEIGELKAYYRQVGTYTNRSVKKFWEVLNPDNKPIGMGEGFYSIDHIYSIIDGFNNKVAPEIVGSIFNLQILLWKENIKKNAKSWIPLEELVEKYEDNNEFAECRCRR